MTLRLYAERKRLPLERVAVRLRHDKIHAKRLRRLRNERGQARSRSTRTLELVRGARRRPRQRLLEIADKCPVHRTLTSEVKIRTKLAE